jgi:hypothetical protein
MISPNRSARVLLLAARPSDVTEAGMPLRRYRLARVRVGRREPDGTARERQKRA